tara:strand:- start:703 stop:993 length:291 start_codon:yes stop_codon:yes gene_type:complete
MTEFKTLEDANAYIKNCEKAVTQYNSKIKYIKAYQTKNKDMINEKNRERYKNIPEEDLNKYKAQKNEYYHRVTFEKRRKKNELKKLERQRIEELKN